MGLYLLDYGAGNVQSLANALKNLGHNFQWISQPSDFAKATVRPPFFLLGLKNIEYCLSFFYGRRLESHLSWRRCFRNCHPTLENVWSSRALTRVHSVWTTLFRNLYWDADSFRIL